MKGITDEEKNMVDIIASIFTAIGAIYLFGWGVYEFKVSQARGYNFELFKHKHETVRTLINYTTYFSNHYPYEKGYDSTYYLFNEFRQNALLEIDDDSLTFDLALFNSNLEVCRRGSRDITPEQLIPYANELKRKAQHLIHQSTQVNSYEEHDTSYLHCLYGWL